MKINRINTQPRFGGKIFTLKIPPNDLIKIENNAKELYNYAKEKPFDYVIFKNGLQKGLSVLVKKLEGKKREVFDILGYPSGNETKDVNLILKTMQKGTEQLSEKDSSIYWSCE